MTTSPTPLSVAEEFHTLIHKRNFILSRVDKACDAKEKVNGAVSEWLDEVDKLIPEMNDLKQVKTSEWCSRMAKKIKTLDEKSKFETFYIPSEISSDQLASLGVTSVYTPLEKYNPQKGKRGTGTFWTPRILQSFPSGNFGFYFNSTEEASEKLLEALKDDSCYVIGLYGKKGSGKTALVRAEIDKYRKIFDRVLFPSVSKNQDFLSIQEGIVNKLDNVHFEREDSDRVRLMKTNSGFDRINGTTLVILDDFPTMYKPQELGIPYGKKRCKVLLTTRDKADCISMECDRSILLKPLSDDESWVLLRKLSGVNFESSLFNVAQKVAFKCNGLPGLIKDVTSSLKKKSPVKWEESLVSLSHSTARYQIFISFRGPDTRDDFTKPLYQALSRKGFRTFKDDESLEGGSPIEKLLDDIEESRFAIIVLSKHYAESEWCLKELAKILECKDDEKKKQLVLPIFYEVLPTDVRHVRNSYANAMGEHEKNGKDSQTIKTWKKALFDVCTLTGFEKPHDWTRDQTDQFIGKIVNFACDHRHGLHIQSMYMN